MNEALVRKTKGIFTTWQQSLVVKNLEKQEQSAKREVEQRQLALKEIVSSGPAALAAHLRKELRIEGADIETLPFPRSALTPAEFVDPPVELETELATAWEGGIEPAAASQPVFWLLLHIGWLEQERFGTDRLADAFLKTGQTQDAETRNFLRRTGGIYVRANVSVFSDCPLARAWWRHRIASATAADGESVSFEDAHQVLHRHRPVWETLVLLSLRRLTVINQPRARAALIAELIERDKPDRETVQQIATALARHGLGRSLEHTPWEELRAITASATE